MKRRAMLLSIAAGACAAVLPPIAPSPMPAFSGADWLRTVQGLTYGQRRQYVAALRGHPVYQGGDKFAELVDLLDDMNQRGSFA